jgi:hypothetical protein
MKLSTERRLQVLEESARRPGRTFIVCDNDRRNPARWLAPCDLPDDLGPGDVVLRVVYGDLTLFDKAYPLALQSHRAT